MRAFLCFFLILGPALAQSKVSLINGNNSYAGLKIELASGYKTYYKTTGESGLPPEFNWAGSQNLAHIDVLWPAPQRFYEGALYLWGYDKSFVLPLQITPLDASRPVELVLQLDYGVCKELCIPQKAKISHKVQFMPSFMVEAALMLVPRPETMPLKLLNSTPTTHTFALPSGGVTDILIESQSGYIYAKPVLTQDTFTIENKNEPLTLTFLRAQSTATITTFKGTEK